MSYEGAFKFRPDLMLVAQKMSSRRLARFFLGFKKHICRKHSLFLGPFPETGPNVGHQKDA